MGKMAKKQIAIFLKKKLAAIAKFSIVISSENNETRSSRVKRKGKCKFSMPPMKRALKICESEAVKSVKLFFDEEHEVWTWPVVANCLKFTEYKDVSNSFKPMHCEFLDYWNTQKSVWRIWQHFLCLLDEGIPNIRKKLNSHGGFLRAD